MTLSIQDCAKLNVKQALIEKNIKEKQKYNPDKINTFILQRSSTIRSLEGIQVFSNLRVLKCTHNKNLNDLSYLKYFHQLESVNLAYNCINDILGLVSSSKSLKKLNLAGNLLSENKSLSKAVASLNVQMSLDTNTDNRIMGQIKETYRSKYQSNKPLEDDSLDFVFQVLNDMTQLEYLDISKNGLTQVPLTLVNLRTLICKDNLITSLQFTPKLYQLATLNVEGNRLNEITELMHLQSCQHLQKICLRNNPLTYSDEYYENTVKFITFKLRIRKLQFIDEFDISAMRTHECREKDLKNVDIQLYSTISLAQSFRGPQHAQSGFVNSNIHLSQHKKQSQNPEIYDSKMFLSQNEQNDESMIPIQSMLQSKQYLDYGTDLVEQVLDQKQNNSLFAY